MATFIGPDSFIGLNGELPKGSATIQSNQLRLKPRDHEEITYTAKCPTCLADLSVTFTVALGVTMNLSEWPKLSHDCPES